MQSAEKSGKVSEFLMSVKKYLFFFLFIQGIAQVMKTKYHMEGSVNGHEFTIEGVGTGNPYE